MDDGRWYSASQTLAGRHAADAESASLRLADRVERILTHLVILGLVLVVLTQFLYTRAELRRLLNWAERIEGQPLAAGVAGPSPGAVPEATPVTGGVRTVTPGGVAPSLTLVLITQPQAPDAFLLVDGERVADFTAGSVTVPVAPGQQLAVDARAEPGELLFRVVAAPGLSQPRLGAQVRAGRDVQPLGTVTLRPPH